jgi:hypothetical protein
VTPKDGSEKSYDNDDDDSVASDGSQITVETLTTKKPYNLPISITPSSPSELPLPTEDILLGTPPEERRKNCKAPADCHILIRCSQLVDLVKENVTCACGKPIVDFERRTIGIAAEIDFNCKS